MLAVGLTLKDQVSVDPQILSSQVRCVCNLIQWIIADECMKEREVYVPNSHCGEKTIMKIGRNTLRR